MKLRKKPFTIIGSAMILVMVGTLFAGSVRESSVLKFFKDLKATHYSHKADYSKAVPDLYLAYDKDGKVIAGAALREFKTYETVTSMVVIVPKNGEYVIHKADIPDCYLIKDDKKFMKVIKAVEAADGQLVRDKAGKPVKVDAVSGATRYQKRLYANFDLLGRKVVEEMLNKPDWPKKPIE